jgi:hypothetical protein
VTGPHDSLLRLLHARGGHAGAAPRARSISGAVVGVYALAIVGGFLLLPEDERVLIEHLTDAEGLLLLASDDLRGGPAVVRRPLHSPPLPPPSEPLRPPEEPDTFIFWWPKGGELRARGDAPAPSDAAGRVALKLAQDATEHWRDLLDNERSPIVRWARCHWHSSGALCPGLLQAQARKTSQQPAELLRLHRRVATWMKKQAVRMNPFDHAPEQLTLDPPANLKMFWAWAFPAAEAWVRDGGTIWPWNA